MAEDSRKPSNRPQALLCSPGSGPPEAEAEKPLLSPERRAAPSDGGRRERARPHSTPAPLCPPGASFASLSSEAWWRATSPASAARPLGDPLRRSLRPGSAPSSRGPCMLGSPGAHRRGDAQETRAAVPGGAGLGRASGLPARPLPSSCWRLPRECRWPDTNHIHSLVTQGKRLKPLPGAQRLGGGRAAGSCLGQVGRGTGSPGESTPMDPRECGGGLGVVLWRGGPEGSRESGSAADAPAGAWPAAPEGRAWARSGLGVWLRPAPTLAVSPLRPPKQPAARCRFAQLRPVARQRRAPAPLPASPP